MIIGRFCIDSTNEVHVRLLDPKKSKCQSCYGLCVDVVHESNSSICH